MFGEKFGKKRGMVVSSDERPRSGRRRIRDERPSWHFVTANRRKPSETFVKPVNRRPFGPVFETFEVECERFGIRMCDVGANKGKSRDFFAVFRRRIGHEIRIPGFLAFRKCVAQILENAAKRPENLRKSGKSGHRDEKMGFPGPFFLFWKEIPGKTSEIFLRTS